MRDASIGPLKAETTRSSARAWKPYKLLPASMAANPEILPAIGTDAVKLSSSKTTGEVTAVA